MKEKKLDEQIKELHSGWQRCQADFENYKKRTEQEKAIWVDHIRIEVFNDLLPILENLDLAVLHAPKKSKDQQWIEGIIYITRQIDTKLLELGIEKIIPKAGEIFDPNIHEAVLSKKNPKFKHGQIIKTQNTGYRLGETIIRPAKVVVAG